MAISYRWRISDLRPRNRLTPITAIALFWAALPLTTACIDDTLVEAPAVSSVRALPDSSAPSLPIVRWPPPNVFQPTLVHAKRADDVVNSVGVNVHLGYFDTPYGWPWDGVFKPKLIALGIRHLRDGGVVYLDDRSNEIVYGRMKELADHGLKFNLIMRPAVGDVSYSDLPQFDRFLHYAAPVIESVEGMNEHDLSWRSDWVGEVRSFQRALFDRIRRDPRTAHVPVYGPSMGDPANAAQVGDLSSHMDYGAIHPYSGGRQPLAMLAEHQSKARLVSGDKPLVATEAGYHTGLGDRSDHPPVSEQAMARYITRLVFEFFDAGVARTYLYELLDQGSTQDREHNFGLLRVDGSEKPAYFALKNLLALLTDPGPDFSPGRLAFTVTGDTVGTRRTLLEKRDRRFYIVIWQAATSFDLATRTDISRAEKHLTVELGAPASQVRIFVPLTGASPVHQVDRVASVSVGVPDSPVVLEVIP